MVFPLEVVYQSMVQSVGAVALKVTVPAPQRLLAEASVGAAGFVAEVLTVLVTASRVADTQPVEIFRA